MMITIIIIFLLFPKCFQKFKTTDYMVKGETNKKFSKGLCDYIFLDWGFNTDTVLSS